MNTGELITVLSGVDPISFQAVQLLTELRRDTHQFFPVVPPEQRGALVAATVELMTYAQRCSELASKLAHLKPIPLREEALLEYPL